MFSTTKYFNCPICFNSKKEKNSTKCKKCKNTHICNECMLNMCERGMSNKCPICRQTEWRKQNLRKNSILPNNSNTNSNSLVKQQSIDSNRFSNHIYEEVDYEARYEMPTIGGTGTAKYENVFTGDKGKNNEYGSQVTTIV